jgi:predicted DNA-binding transcriptional regulator YafY
MQDKRMQRLVRFVAEMKEGHFPNAVSFARLLMDNEWDDHQPMGVSPKTVQRDIAFLNERFHPPMAYDPAAKGYCLVDMSWSLPYLSLAENELFAALFSNRVSEPFLPAPILQAMGDVKTAELAAGEPGNMRLEVLESLVVATGGSVPVVPALAQTVLRAWKDARRLRICYTRGADGVASERDIDIHALFLSDGAWYARAFCHLLQGVRSFALHRVSKAALLEVRFQRSAAVVEEVRRGRVFDYDFVSDVCVTCVPERAKYFREREWFAGQQIREQPDGSLAVCYPAVPAPLVEQWVLSFGGAVTVTAPSALRERIRLLAVTLATGHEASPVA